MKAIEFFACPKKRAGAGFGLSGTNAAMTEASKTAQDPMLCRLWETAFRNFLTP
jgi:hypothetical protein